MKGAGHWNVGGCGRDWEKGGCASAARLGRFLRCLERGTYVLGVRVADAGWGWGEWGSGMLCSWLSGVREGRVYYHDHEHVLHNT